MKKIIDYILRTKLFEGLDERKINTIYPHFNAKIFSYKKGEVVVNTEDMVNNIGILLSGELDIIKEDIYGNMNLIRKVIPYETFLADVVCTPSRISPIQILCATDSATLTFSYEILFTKGIIPDAYRCILLKNILNIIANDNIRQLYKIEILSKKSLRDRVVMYLLFQAKKHGTNNFTLSFNREELATYLSIDRSALSRELSKMQKEGLIKYKKNRFQIISDLKHIHIV